MCLSYYSLATTNNSYHITQFIITLNLQGENVDAYQFLDNSSIGYLYNITLGKETAAHSAHVQYYRISIPIREWITSTT